MVIGYVSSRGFLKPIDYKVAPTSPLPDWVNRANRAHMNAVENLASFATVVLIAKLVGVSTPVTEMSAAVFFYARAAHAVIHISGFTMFKARNMAFTVSWIAFMTFAIELLRHVI